MRRETRPRSRDEAEDGAAPPSSLRLFVAFALSDEVRVAMRRRLGRLRSLLPQARWVDPDNAHLTLAFLGHQPEAKVEPLTAALRDVFWRYPGLPLRLHGGGTFPQGRPARVAWVGVKGPPELLPLQHDVADAAASVLEWEPEKRPFHPHVTLTRCNPTWPRALVERFHSEVQGSWGEEFVATEGRLYRSRLSPRGAQYQVLERFPLRRAEAP
ncbi:MAG TPA: RNA 2',3'-cyclic phosphodiesterase [Thermoanaerobaculia bacterium]|nr:RNA 2',3'-cyclic phosphodiesterase [Thermoanaerobaculia bacterium]